MAITFQNWSSKGQTGIKPQIPTSSKATTPVSNGSGRYAFQNWSEPTPTPTATPSATPAPAKVMTPSVQPQTNAFENFLGNAVKTRENIASTIGTGAQIAQQDISALGKQPITLPGGLKINLIQPTKNADIGVAPPITNKSKNPLAPGGSTLSAYTPTIWDKITQIFNNFTGYDSDTQKALAMNAYALKTQAPQATKNTSLTQLAEPPGNPVKNSPAENITAQLGVRNTLSDSEFANLLMTAGAGLGLAEAPVVALKGLGLFTAVNSLKSGLISAVTGHGFNPTSGDTLSNLLPEDSPPQLKTALDVIDFLGSAGVTHQIYTKSPAAFDAITKQILTKYHLPQVFTIDPATLKDIQTTGKMTPQNVQDAFKQLQLSGSERASIAKGNSIDITIPGSRISTLVDRPYWAAIKSVFRIAPTDRTLTGESTGQPTVSDHIAGLLPEGEYTPTTVRKVIMNSPLAQTPEAKTVISASVQADQQGKNVHLSKVDENQQQPDESQTALSEKIPTTRPAFTSKVAQQAQSQAIAKLEEIRNNSSSQEDQIKQFNDSFVQILDSAKGNRDVLAGIRTALSKEIQGIAGHTGNYKGDYAMMKTLQDDPTIGKYISTLEGHIATLDNMLFSSDKQNVTNLEDIKTELATLPEGEDKTTLTNIIKELSSEDPLSGESQYALDLLIHADNFEEFTQSVGELEKEFDNQFTQLHNEITSGTITQAEYESFSKQYRQSVQNESERESSQSSQNSLSQESSNKGTETNSVSETAKGNKPESENTKGSEFNAIPEGGSDARAGERTDSATSESTDRTTGTGTSIEEENNKDYVPKPLSTESFKDTQLFESIGNPEAGFINPDAITKSVSDLLTEYKQKQEDNRFGEALRAYFVGERDVRIAETNQLVEGFAKKVKMPVQQEALTLMRDFKGREEELQLLLDGLHPYYDKAVTRFKEDNPEATEKEVQDFADQLLKRGRKLENIIKWAQKPTEEMKAVDNEMTKYFTYRLKEGQNLGFLESKLNPEEYITHLLTPKEQVPTSKGMFASKNKIGRYFAFSKGRAYKDVVEAYLNGSDPKTLNALDAMSIYGDKHATATATRLLIKELKDTQLGKYGSRKSEYIPSDWEEIAPESNLFKNEVPFIKEEAKEGMSDAQIEAWDKKVAEGRAKFTDGKYQEADIAHQSLFAPAKVVDALKPITQGDYLGQLPGFAKTKLYQGFLKTAELGLSVFHMRAMTITSMANQDVLSTVRSIGRSMNTPQFKEIERNFIKAGGTTSVLGRTIEAYHATRKPSMQGFLLKETPIVHQIDQIAHGLTKVTFNVLQRKFKVTDFALKDAQWMGKHPNATAVEHYAAQKSIAKEINAAYGGLQWEILGFSKMLQNVLRFLILAPDWTFSNFFNLKYAGEWGTPAGQKARAFIIRGLFYGFILNQMWSILMSGKTSDDPTKAYLGNDPQGKKIYVNFGFAGLQSDAVNLLKNIGDYGVVQGFFTTLSNKESPTLRTASQFLSNRNYLGQAIIPKGSGPVVGTARSAVELAQGLSPIPFIVQNFFNMLTDSQHKYIPQEYLSIIAGGGTPTHVVPGGMRQVTSGKNKGKLVKSTPSNPRPLLEQIMTGKINEPKVKKAATIRVPHVHGGFGGGRGGFHIPRKR